MASRTKTLYGVIVLLVALLVIVSTLSAYYYFEYNMVSQNNSKLNSELQAASSKYSSLATHYNSLASNFTSSLSSYNGSVKSFQQLVSVYDSVSSTFRSLSQDYNLTFSLLVSSLSVLNTSTPAYVNASLQLSSLWSQYLAITSQYKNTTSNFELLLASYGSANNVVLNETVTTVSVSLLTANILIDYGNGTVDWFNNTAIDPGWNFYISTVVITNGNVNATWYPEYSEHLVNAIDGVFNNDNQNIYWWLWTYNATESSWNLAQVGPDMIPMYNGSSYAWTYCAENTLTYLPECTPQ